MKKEVNMRKEFKKEGQGSNSHKDTIITDPNGSYTGVAVDNKFDKPVQDVDDL